VILGNFVAAAVVFCLGAYTVTTRRNLIKMILGLSLMEASTYVFIISLAYRNGSTAPVLLYPPPGKGFKDLIHGNVADPFLQNICLTAIVIGVAVTAVLLSIVVRTAQHYRSIDADDVRELKG
jgi:multicomponent Na+:H+ antiporter subunit C